MDIGEKALEKKKKAGHQTKIQDWEKEMDMEDETVEMLDDKPYRKN